MQYGELIDKVGMRLRFSSSERAGRTTIVTLSASGEFISPEAARDLGYRLPAQMAVELDHGPPDEASWEDFTQIVAEKEGAGVIAEGAAAQAVGAMRTIREAYYEAGDGPEGEAGEARPNRPGQDRGRASGGVRAPFRPGSLRLREGFTAFRALLVAARGFGG